MIGGLKKKHILLAIGVCLLLTALILLAVVQGSAQFSTKKAAEYVNRIYDCIPEPHSAVAEKRENNTMPSLSLDGRSFIAVLEFPLQGESLPIEAAWDAYGRFPCRFDGSVYDSSLVIGGSSRKGQFAFFREISCGDCLYLTDMTGRRYAFEVYDLSYSTRADRDTLQSADAALTIFVKNEFSFEYLIVRCRPQ